MKSDKSSHSGHHGSTSLSMSEVGSGTAHLSNDLEHQLYQLGIPIGEKVLELLFYREKGGASGACSSGKRETKLVPMLHFINGPVFKALFGRSADGLEQSIEDEDEYRILDRSPITNRFANLGKNSTIAGSTNCAAFIAGIIEGILCSSKLYAKVTAHLYGDEESGNPSATGTGEGAGETTEAATPSPDGSSSTNNTTIYVIKFAREVTNRERVGQ